MSKDFDPNSAAPADSGIFGLPDTDTDASLILIPVPWEATTSYGQGTALGPSAILRASHQVDLYELEVERPYEAGIYMAQESELIHNWNQEAKANKDIAHINQLSHKLNHFVHTETWQIYKADKIPAIVGGDHSTPFGAFEAAGTACGDYGILHFDAHSDTRAAYQGYEHSHASIMYNAITKIPQIKKLVQVGIRDFCEQEKEFTEKHASRIDVFYDARLAKAKFEGKSWSQLCERIIHGLPKKVWVSFDIDGLDPRYCPNTGTPVPGGLDFQEAVYLIATVVRSGRTIIGFDLNEVAPSAQGDEWDANVGARMLYKLCAWTLASQKKCKILNP